MSHIISKVQSLVRAGLMPYWDVDPEEIDSDGKPGINAIKRFYGRKLRTDRNKLVCLSLARLSNLA
jgi:hypothetical protein